MKVSDVFASVYIGETDVKKPVRLTIATMTMEQFRDAPAPLPVFSFRGTKKLFVLRATNARRLVADLGDDMAGWVGEEIVLEPNPDKRPMQPAIIARAANAPQPTAGEKTVMAAQKPISSLDDLDDALPF